MQGDKPVLLHRFAGKDDLIGILLIRRFMNGVVPAAGASVYHRFLYLIDTGGTVFGVPAVIPFYSRSLEGHGCRGSAARTTETEQHGR